MRRNAKAQTLPLAVKQGYLRPGAAELAASQVFCMTPGTATNDFATLPFKNLEGEYYYVKTDSEDNVK